MVSGTAPLARRRATSCHSEPPWRTRTPVLKYWQAAHRRMVRAWAAPHSIRRVASPPPAGQVSGRLPAVLAPARCPGRPGSRRSRRFVRFPISYFLYPLDSSHACFEVDLTGATHPSFAINRTRPRFPAIRCVSRVLASPHPFCGAPRRPLFFAARFHPEMPRYSSAILRNSG
jgi:hypothetical protein